MQTRPVALLISIVTFAPDRVWLARTLSSLGRALAHARKHAALTSATVVLVSNDATPDSTLDALLTSHLACCDGVSHKVLSGHGNVGYGRANNLAVAHAEAQHVHDVLLVLNPDVEINEGALTHALHYLAEHDDCAMVSPVARDAQGAPLYLAKRYPTLPVLMLRGFALQWLRAKFARALAHYERREVPFDADCADLRIVSGCFMLMPMRVYQDTGGFDTRFFLYFEDFDLSLRASKLGRIVRLPACEIVHGGGDAARKGVRHVGYFLRSALQFFAKHGWAEKTTNMLKTQ